MVCRNCGAQLPENATFCQNCGTATQPAQPQYQPVQPQYQPVQPIPVAPVTVPGKGQGVASMVLGIISLVLFCIWYIALPCAIISLILGAVGSSNAKKAGMKNGMATAGIVMSCIALGLALLAVAGAMAFLNELGLM